ncbi:MAG: tyrosine-protein phosphatase, partial [Thermodesulfobacteriota bacterium]
MIDIHCHLLPNIDDGPRSWDESLELAQMLSEEGVKIAITTPHWIKGSGWEPEPDKIKDMVDELNERLEKEKIPLKVLPGMEVGITENILELVNQGRILTLNSSPYLLIETPFISIPYGIEEVIFRLKESGIVPIFAHPERCREVQSNRERLKDLSDTGALIQITTSSLLGYFGNEAMESAITLTKEGLVHFVATDAHSSKKRPPIIIEAFSILNNIVGQERVKALKDNAYQVIHK